jgi:hypothetical protein
MGMQAAIPQEKHVNALIFCKDAILDQLAENFSHTVQTLSTRSIIATSATTNNCHLQYL